MKVFLYIPKYCNCQLLYSKSTEEALFLLQKLEQIMKNYILMILLQFFISINLFSQDYSSTDFPISIEFGVGNGMYDDIKSQQILFFIDTPFLRSSGRGLELSTKLNIESIQEDNHDTFLAGVVPIFKYNIEIQQISFFVKGGIGFNYISKHKIASRDLGGHLIFSDMIGVGISLLKNKYYSFEISYLFRHISNAGFFEENEGYNSQYFLFSITI